MSLDKLLTESMSAVPDCLAAAYIDIGSGMLLGVRTVDTHPQPVLDMVAATTADLFQGPNVALIESHFRAARGDDRDSSNHYFKEIFVFSDNLLHVFLRTKKNPDHVLCFVCRKAANIGMVLSKSRMVVETFAEQV